MGNEYSTAAHWPGDFEEAGLQKWAENLRRQLAAPQVSLGLVFMSPRFFPRAKQVLEILRVHARIPLLAGCSSQSLIVGEHEVEQNAGLTRCAVCVAGGRAERRSTLRRSRSRRPTAPATGIWRPGSSPAKPTAGWPSLIRSTWTAKRGLRTWNEAYAPLPVLGGLASGDFSEQATQVYLNGEVFEEGGVAISVGGEVRLVGVTSQGCTPIGETWTLTKVEQNIIHQIGNRPAYEVLAETFNQLTPEQQKTARGNLFIGLVVNEYLEDFHRGDFLIRNLLGADPRSGSIAVGALPRLGQTIQFQRRSAAAATEDMEELLTRARKQLGDTPIYGGCLCSCNGRGQNLFGRPNHDAQMVQQRLGPMGLAGFFCNGEIGPVGEKSFLHGYTASLALFVKK